MEKNNSEETNENVAKVDICNNNSIYANDESKTAAFKTAQYMATMNMLPDSYKGSTSNCLFAIGIAKNLNLDPVYVMQNSQMIKGHFTWSGKAFKSMIDNNPNYSQVQYIEVGDPSGAKDANGVDIPIHNDNWGIYIQAFDKKLNKFVYTEPITMKMAKAEGWYGKLGSKWQTMPRLMMMYRAASFFVNTNCPSLALGFQTTEEVFDISKDNHNSNSIIGLLEKEKN